MGLLGVAYWQLGMLDRSVPLFEELLALQKLKLGPEHAETSVTKGNLGVNYKDSGRVDKALPLLEEAVLASRTIPNLQAVRTQLLDGYVLAGQTEKALAFANQILDEDRARLPADSLPLAGSMTAIGSSLLNLKAWTAAERVLRESVKIREAKRPGDWFTFNAKSILGGALLGQKKYAEAEPYLRAGYEGMKKQADKVPSQARTFHIDAVNRLIELAEATGKSDEAKKWKAEKATLPLPPTAGKK